MTNLQEVSQKDLLISLANLDGETELIQDIQEKLGKIGLVNLTKVSLGNLDPETSEALAMFQEAAHRSVLDGIDRSFAQKLIDVTANTHWPIDLDEDGMVGLTKAALNEVRPRKSRNRGVEKTLPNMELHRTTHSKIGSYTNPEIKLPHIITDAQARPESSSRVHKTSPEAQRQVYASSEFLAWARH